MPRLKEQCLWYSQNGSIVNHQALQGLVNLYSKLRFPSFLLLPLS